MSRGSRLSRDFGVVFAGQIMASLQGLIVLPIVIRLAGEATYGAYVLLTSIIGLLFGVLGYGVPYRYQRKLPSTSNWIERRELFEPQFMFQLGVVAAVSAGVVGFGARMEKWLFADTVHVAPWVLVAFLAARLLSRQANDYCQYTQRYIFTSSATASAPYLFVAMLIIAATFTRQLSLDSLFIFQGTASILVSAPLLWLLLREIGLPRLHLPVRALMSDFRMGLPLMLELGTEFVLGAFDRYLICFFLSVADVGKYQPAYQLGSVILLFPNLLGTVLMPALSRLVDQNKQAEGERLIAACLQLFLMIAIPFAVGALMIGTPILSWFATREVAMAGRWALPLVAVGSVFYGVWLLASLVALVSGSTRALLGATAVGAGVNLAINCVFLPLIRDITVAAAATLIGYAVSCACAAVALRPHWRMPVAWAAVLRFCCAALTMGALLWLLGFRPAVIPDDGPSAVVGALITAAVAYFAVLSGLGGFRRRDVVEMLSSLRPSPGSLG